MLAFIVKRNPTAEAFKIVGGLIRNGRQQDTMKGERSTLALDKPRTGSDTTVRQLSAASGSRRHQLEQASAVLITEMLQLPSEVLGELVPPAVPDNTNI